MKKLILLILFLLILFAVAVYVIEYKMPYEKTETNNILQEYQKEPQETLNKQASSISNKDKKVAELEEREKWQRVAKHLYFNKNSVDIQYDNYISGTFKEYLYGKERENENQNAAYQIIETAAFCNIELQNGIKKLEYPIYQFYDENNNFISEDNIHKAWKEEFPDGHLGITHPESEKNGDIYFDTLCSYAK